MATSERHIGVDGLAAEALPLNTRRITKRNLLRRLPLLAALAVAAKSTLLTAAMWVFAWWTGRVEAVRRYDWTITKSSGPWGRDYAMGEFAHYAAQHLFFAFLVACFYLVVSNEDRVLASVVSLWVVILIVIAIAHIPLVD